VKGLIRKKERKENNCRVKVEKENVRKVIKEEKLLTTLTTNIIK